ncbi:MAG: hypothetical protein HKN88_01720 [Gammaproteobacteria bacterium]|nr:hypothetical protein [Gammaproteobacteria bacterium]NNM13502.1 hypothetical protein [Gammaproteobacteria bacterium]
MLKIVAKSAVITLTLLALNACVIASESLHTDPSTTLKYTKRLANGELGQKATLKDVAWLVGSWEGEAFGSKFEEVWNPPSMGSMLGMFKLFNDKGIIFYEILLLVEENDSLSLKVKHFNPDFSAWEEKPDYVNFRLVSIEKDAIHFSGISFYKRSDNEIEGYIVFRDGDKLTENKLVYRRVK